MGKTQRYDYGTRAPVKTWRPVAEDAATELLNVYAANFFAKRFIAIPDQQVRAFNLCFALTKIGKIKRDTRVAIVGAGISGMTCAVALAMLKGCHVLVFERETKLLRKLREAAFRFIHPDMNASTDSDAADFHPRKRTNFAFMNWSANRAPAVAEEMCRKFDHYRAHSRISLHLGEDVQDISADASGAVLLFKEGKEVEVDVVILATGFGAERKDDATTDASYWHSGNASQYLPTTLGEVRSKGGGANPAERKSVVISGNGDSAVIELAHFLMTDFQHEMVATMLPSNVMGPSLGLLFAQQVENLWFRQIEFHQDDESQLQGPLSWYWWMRELRQIGEDRWSAVGTPLARPFIEEIYFAFDQLLAPTKRHSMLPRKLMAQVEDVTEPLLNKLASLEIEDLMGTYVADKLLIPRDGAFRNDFDVRLVGSTPTMYSRRQSPQNWFVLFFLKKYGKFEYVPGRFRAAGVNNGQIAYRVEDEGQLLFTDKLVVRQGPDYESLAYDPSIAQLDSSQYRLTHVRNLEREPSKVGDRYQDAFVTFFRTGRWRKAVKAKMLFSDYREGEEPFNSPQAVEEQLDECFLDLARTEQGEAAFSLYRQAKSTANLKRRFEVLAEMLQVRSQALPKV
jgi:hypothetical protein